MKKHPADYITVSNVLYLFGSVIVITGITFIISGQTSSGVTMDEYGGPYGKGTIDGWGMIFCGILFLVFGYAMMESKKDKEDLKHKK